MEIQSATLRLGDTDYTVRAAGFRRAKVWKKRLLSELKPLFENLNGAPGMEFNKPEDLFKLLPLAENLLVDGVDSVLMLLLSYDPALEAARAEIEENASDRQIIEAFREVVSLADPFGIAALLNQQLGRVQSGISLSLPSPSGT